MYPDNHFETVASKKLADFLDNFEDEEMKQQELDEVYEPKVAPSRQITLDPESPSKGPSGGLAAVAEEGGGSDGDTDMGGIGTPSTPPTGPSLGPRKRTRSMAERLKSGEYLNMICFYLQGGYCSIAIFLVETRTATKINHAVSYRRNKDEQ